MKKFEYKFALNLGDSLTTNDDFTNESLNDFGRDGWELVAVSRCGTDFNCLGFYSKRELSK